MLSTSKESFNMTANYIKHYLHQHNHLSEADASMSSEQYIQMWRSLTCRELIIAPLDGGNLHRPIEAEAFTHYSRYSTCGVKDLSMGFKFTIFHLYDNSIVFLKTQEYLDSKSDALTLWRANHRPNVKKFFTIAKHLMYLTDEGKLVVVYDEDNKPSHQLSEQVLKLSDSCPLNLCAVSYTYAIIGYKQIDQSSEEAKDLEADKPLTSTSNSSKQVIQTLSLADLKPDDFDSADRLSPITGLEDADLIDYAVGSAHAYFISHKYVLYECDLSKRSASKLVATPFEPFKRKPICRVFPGPSYYFAVEQDKITGIGTWTNDEVLNWARSSGFQDFCKILKYEAVDGFTIANADRNYVINTLGMDE